MNKLVPFEFTKECMQGFVKLKEKLTLAPIIVAPNWSFPFKVMCDVNDYAIGAVLGQRKNQWLHVIYYASKVLNETWMNYATTEKEMLAIVFAYDKFHSYLIEFKSIVFANHLAIKYLLEKEFKPQLIRWIFLLQEFDMKIMDKKGTKDLVANHFSKLETNAVVEEDKIKEVFSDEQLLAT